MIKKINLFLIFLVLIGIGFSPLVEKENNPDNNKFTTTSTTSISQENGNSIHKSINFLKGKEIKFKDSSKSWKFDGTYEDAINFNNYVSKNKHIDTDTNNNQIQFEIRDDTDTNIRSNIEMIQKTIHNLKEGKLSKEQIIAGKPLLATDLINLGEYNQQILIYDVQTLTKQLTEQQTALKTTKDKKDIQDNIDKLEKELNENMDFVVDNVGMNKVLDSMNQTEQEEFADQYAERNCGNGFSGWVCKAFTTSSAQEQSRIAYMQEIQELDKDYATKKKKLEEGIENCNGVVDLENYFCNGDAQIELDGLNDKYNEDLNEKLNEKLNGFFPKDTKIKNSCENSFDEICRNAINNINCEGTNAKKCKSNKKKALNMLDENEKNQFIETGLVYEVFSFLKDDFESGKTVARAFHIQPKYENVPEWLNDTFASKICMAKIGGYLTDKLIGNDAIKDGYNPSNFDTGGTRYGSCVQDDKNPNTQQSSLDCTEVKADIRATKSQLTPDNKIWISYSALLKTPTSGEVTTAIMLSYTQGKTNKKQKKIIKFLNISNSEGKYWQDYNNYELEINTTYGKINDNMLIWIRSLNSDKSKYIVIKDTVYNITSDKYDGINFGNSQGNKNAKENKKENPIDEDYMMDDSNFN